MKLRIDTAFAADCGARLVYGEDGPREEVTYLVVAEYQGHALTHPRHFYWASEARDFAEKVASRGVIDPALWNYSEPDDRSLEERWNDYADQEQEMRLGLREEGDYR